MNVHRLLLLGGRGDWTAGSIDAMHALLARQVRRHFGSREAVPAEWRDFLRDVDEAYREMDADRGILERSLEISSEEQNQANVELRALFQAFPDLFFRVDASGRILDYKVGSGIDALLPGQDMIGRDIRRVQQPEAARKLSEGMERVGATRGLVAVEYALDIAGRVEHYEARLGPLARGEMFVIVRNITARKLAEERVLKARDELELKVHERTRQLTGALESLRESEEWVRNILSNVPTGIVVIDPATREILDANPLALSLLKLKRHEVLGRSCTESLCRAVQGACPLCETGRPGNDTPELLRADGSRIHVQRTVTPVVLGGRRVMLETLVDITERRRAEAELREARAASEAASEAKSRFLALMSHEIRTPLNGVIGVLHLLRRDARPGPEQQRLMQMAVTSADTLLRVINDILDFSKIEAGKLDLHPGPLDLRQTIAETASLFIEKAREKGLDWSVRVAPSVPRTVLGDAGRVAQVLGNLLANAVKFTESGEILLEAEGSCPVRVSITDTGIGIPRDQQARLFEPFHQVDASPRRRYEGTGLGLGICQQLVQLMGGVMGFRSEPGRGSTFWFEVPFQVVPDELATDRTPGSGLGASALNTAPDRSAARRGRVLLVEDNEINQELARVMIEAAGSACECTNDGRGAVQAALSGAYDLILMDCMMPEMDGYEATRAIRAGEAGRPPIGRAARIPIVALTANAMKGDRERCLAAGMDDYLAKPIDPADLVRMLAKWMPGQVTTGLLASGMPPGPTPIDGPVLLRRCMGRRELAARLIAKLVGQGERDLEAAVQAVQRGDAAALTIAAHRLKGAAANVAAGGLQRVAADLESLGRAGNLTGASPLLERLRAEFARLQSAAAIWRSDSTISGAATA